MADQRTVQQILNEADAGGALIMELAGDIAEATKAADEATQVAAADIKTAAQAIEVSSAAIKTAVEALADSIDSSGVGLITTVSATIPDLVEAVPLTAKTAGQASHVGPKIDLRDLYRNAGADQMVLILVVTASDGATTINCTLDWFDTDANGVMSATAARQDTAKAAVTNTGTNFYVIPIQDQFWAGLTVTMVRSAGAAAWTAGVTLGYVKPVAVRQ